MSAALDAGAVEAVEDVTRRAVEAQTVADFGDEVEGVAVRVVRGDETLRMVDLEGKLDTPRRQRGESVAYDAQSFAAQVTRLHATGCTTMWADLEHRTVVAVLNDHYDSLHTVHGDDVRSAEAAAGWRDNRVALRLQPDPDWDAWVALSGQLTPQLELAEWLENMLHTIEDPAAADLLEPILTFTTKRNLQVDSATRLASGAVQFSYREEDQSTGTTVLPEQLKLKLRPYRGADQVIVTARLRYRLVGGALRFVITLVRPDLAELEAWAGITAQIIEGTPAGTPMYQGTAPAPVAPPEVISGNR